MFYPESWLPKVEEFFDSVPLCDFMFDDKYGRRPINKSQDAYTCGLTGKSISAQEQKDRVQWLARALSKELGWKVNEGTEFEKTGGIFAQNTIDVMTVSWALHRLNGISSPANAAYNASELSYQLNNSDAKCLFTVQSLLSTALEAAEKCKIAKTRIYILEMPGDPPCPKQYKTVTQLIEEGKSLPDLPGMNWTTGQGKRQVAFLCYSSGTSGLPKGVMIAHSNVIANVLQMSGANSLHRKKWPSSHKEVAMGLLPQSHIYCLVVICHLSTFEGDCVVILPKFELQSYLTSISKYSISTLYIVPPIIIAMIKNEKLLSKYDLSSVVGIYTGAAPLGAETAAELSKQYPTWSIRQGYGSTETCTVVTQTSPLDTWLGSSGSLIPSIECKIMDAEGNEITAYDTPGELLVKSPSVTLGYLKNEKATAETFVQHAEGRFMRTGDEVMVRRAPSGKEHYFIVDRIKELIKTKGHQVAPAELESCLLNHPAVADCCVIPVPDDFAGELPKAYVVKSSSVGLEESDAALKRSIQKHVEKEKSKYKWLTGGVEFIDTIPKSPSGKILRRLLRDREREKRRKDGAKM